VASRFWIGTGAWNTTNTANWSATSGGATGAAVPTNADDVFFDALSTGTCTLGAGVVARSINCTGFTGTIVHSAATGVLIGDATAGAGNIALKLVAGMTYTVGAPTTSTITFVSTSATVQTIDWGGKATGAVTYNGVGGSWQYLSAQTSTGASVAMTLTAGALDLNGQTTTLTSFATAGTLVRSLTMGASTLNYSSSFAINSTTNFTLNAGTSSIVQAGGNATFAGAGLTFFNVSLAPAGGGIALGGANTFNNLTFSGSNSGRVSISADQTVNGLLTMTSTTAATVSFVLSNVMGTTRTLTAASVSVGFTNFQDITAAGASAPWSAPNAGDVGGNTGITFSAPVTRYWVATAGASWRLTTSWSATSGGASGASVPMAHDTAVFDANSIVATGKTITVDAQCIPALDFTNLLNQPTIALQITNGQVYINGSVTYRTDLGNSGTGSINVVGRGSYTINTAGHTLSNTFIVAAFGGTYTLLSDFILTNPLTLTNGVLNANGFNVTTTTMGSSSTNVRSLFMGSGAWTITGTGGTVWNISTGTNMTMNTGTATLALTGSGGGTRTLSSAVAYPAVTVLGTSTDVLTSSGLAVVAASLDFTGFTGTWNAASSTLGSLTLNPGMTMSYGNTITITGAFNAVGSLGNLITIKSATAGTQRTITKASGVVSADYLSLQDSNVTGGATWYAGANSTNVSNNTGWLFSAAPALGRTGLLLMGIG
jgi:hypothetical protein